MKFIAHRGYSAKYPENTLEAFNAVIANPHFKNGEVSGIELDIQLTADEKLVVYHNNFLEQNGERIPLGKMDYNNFSSILRKADERMIVPLFHEVLECVSHKTALFVEIKDGLYNVNHLMKFLKDLFEKYKPSRDIIVHSFSIGIMKAALQELKFPEIEFGFLCSGKDALEQAGDEFISQMDYIHPQFEFLLDNEALFLKYGKALNNVWTVNDAESVRKLKNSKCSHLIKAVTTDDLELIKAAEKL